MKFDVSTFCRPGRLTVIAGPCVIESHALCRETVERLLQITRKYPVDFVFKASFDKANRTSVDSFRGPGLERGLAVLAAIQKEFNVPLITDIHGPEQAAPVAKVVDVLQIPAFLSRQTDLLLAAAQTGKAVMVKKAQFMAPEDMVHVAKKFRSCKDAGPLTLCERGSVFGYQNLVVDMRGLTIMKQLCGAPVVFDATHSVQRPSAMGGVSGGDRNMAPILARAATAVGIDGLFSEVHPNPDAAKSDGANSLTFELFESMLTEVLAIRRALGADENE